MELNKELAMMARNIIAEMRKEGWDEDDIKWSTCGALLKHCEAQGTIDDPTKYDMAAIQVIVVQCMKEAQDA